MLYIVYDNLSVFFANVVAIIIGVAMWLCGLVVDHVDGAHVVRLRARRRHARLALHQAGEPDATARRSGRSSSPASLAVLICLYAAAYFVVTSISTITLYLAYMFPIYLNWRNRRRGQGEFTTPATAPWNLGPWGPVLNVIAIVWVLFLTVIFSLPPNELVLWTMLALTVGLRLYWQLSAKRTFVGPTRADEQALRRLESAVGEGSKGAPAAG